MYRFLILVTCLSLIKLIDLVPATQEAKIIENPSYELAKTGLFKISKIELSDTETRITLEFRVKPGWWVKYGADTFVTDPKTGEKYTITKLGEHEFDKEIYVDATGFHSNVLIFPPLPSNIDKIDYNNQFYGVSLTGEQFTETSVIPKHVTTWMTSELAKVKTKPIENFESKEFFSTKPAKIIGYIRGYDTRLGFDTGIFYATNELTREDYPVVIDIYPDGRFEADIPLIHPLRSMFIINSVRFYFYLEPGQTLALVVDWEKFLQAEIFSKYRIYPSEEIAYKGKLSQINTELASFELEPFDYNEFMKMMMSMSPIDFKNDAFEKKVQNDAKLDSFFATHQLLNKTKILLREKNHILSVGQVMDYLMDKDYHKKQNPDNQFLKEKIENSYYSFLQDFPLHKQSLLVDYETNTFINRFEYADPLKFWANLKPIKIEKTLYEYFEEQNIDLTEAEKELYTKPHDQEAYEKLKPAFEAFAKKYEKESKAYNDLYITPLVKANNSAIDFMEPWRKKDSVLTNELHLKNDLIYDITKTRSLKFQLDRMNSAEEAYEFWKELSKSIENDFVKQEGQRLIDEKFPKQHIARKLDGNTQVSLPVKTKSIPLPDGKAKDLFYKIANTYKGKIVFVDFWATTCGPCVGTIKNMKNIRKKYRDNPDFEFVFITDARQSPEENYNTFVKEQEMENIYRVDTDMYNRFRELFKFNGIPRYIVLDKQGNFIDDDFQMHNFEALLPNILKNNK
tara:strand:- start:96037 stop:98250 length:2214 start_codon:yes stop_codon:yes gene_type:complete